MVPGICCNYKINFAQRRPYKGKNKNLKEETRKDDVLFIYSSP